MNIININDINEMKKFGIKLGSRIKGSEVILLEGDLGAGKTHLTKFIAQGMGIDDYVTSPSFALLNIYQGPVNIYHFDAYRLDDDEDLDNLGFDEYIYSDGVSIIEWPQKLGPILPKDTLEIKIQKTGEESRRLEIACADKLSYLVEGLI